MQTHDIGTINYMAPEIIDKDSGYTNMCDLWSLAGVLMYTCSNGHHPFTGNHARQHILEAKYKSGKCASKLTSEARDVIMRLLVVNVDERLTLDGILSHPWIASDKLDIEEEVNKLIDDYHIANVPNCPPKRKKEYKEGSNARGESGS